MKKPIIVEIVLLVALLLVALLLNSVMNKNKESDEVIAQPVETTTEATETEPPPTWNTYSPDRAITAQQYFVYDLGKQTYITISGSGDERIYPASVTKLFTAYTALQYLEPLSTITAGEALTLVVPGSSVADIKEGERHPVETLITAMLLPSGNDAAYILAVEAGRQIKNDNTLSPSAAAGVFVDRMNQLAKEMGMTGTNFVNPDGIHKADHYTTFDDLVIMAELSLNNEIIASTAEFTTSQVSIGDDTQKLWHNTNALIDPNSSYYCPYAVGLKTGQTPSAGSCLLSAFRYEDATYVVGVFGCEDEKSRFDDTLQLFNQAAGIE